MRQENNPLGTATPSRCPEYSTPFKMESRILLRRLVTLQSRVAPGKFSCGLGVRAVRAGSIGREGQRLGERDEYPPEGAGGLGPRPGEISAL